MILKYLSDQELLSQTKSAALREREATLTVLHHIREVERRQLFAHHHSSLFTYCTEELGYDPGSAQLRISAMRLLRELPELETKVDQGALNLTLLSQAQTYFRREGIKESALKKELLSKLEGKSTREAQKELLKESKNPEVHISEKVRPISETHSELRLVIDQETLDQLNELKALLSHTFPHATLKDLIGYAVKEQVKQSKPQSPKRKSTFSHEVTAQQSSATANATSATAVLSQAEIKRQVWQRDEGRCTYASASSPRTKCGSRSFLELDHIKPKAMGGEATLENQRLRCRTHNRLHAIESYGAGKISRYVKSMR